MPNPYGRAVVSDEEYARLEEEHRALIDAMNLGPDAIEGRCMSHPRDCRCYWPLKQSEADAP